MTRQQITTFDLFVPLKVQTVAPESNCSLITPTTEEKSHVWSQINENSNS